MYIYYVYAYINKKTGLPYYIGKGRGKRAFSYHGRVSVPKDKSKIIFLETNLSDIGAIALERRLIRWYGRKDINTGILLNMTDGGEGASGRIFKHTEESKRKTSLSLKGRPMKESTKLLVSKVHKGKTVSEKTKRKLSEISKEWWRKRKENQRHTSMP